MIESYKPHPVDITKIAFNGKLIKRHVVCAANKFKCGTIVCGARHWDTLMSALVDKLNLDDKEHEQGFVDQYQHFISREEAAIIAIVNNQSLRQKLVLGDVAFSEDFY